MVVSSSSLFQKFKQAFNVVLSGSELDLLYQQLEIIKPEPGEPFWNSASSSPGIYLILEGKVRLLDDQDNLLVSLSEGTILGQISLFSQAELKSHSARASWGLKLGYLSLESLQEYLLPQSNLEQYLYRQSKVAINQPQNLQLKPKKVFAKQKAFSSQS